MNTINVRTSCPKKSDRFAKCYKRALSGGWSNCIKGNPTEEYVDVLRNCVGFATGRFNEIIDEIENTEGMRYQIKSNAETFIEKAKKLGLEISQTPSPGAIAVWEGLGDLAGHVAICEYPLDLNPKALKMFTSESGWNSSRAFWNAVRSNANGRFGSGAKYRFLGFIVNPAVKRIMPAIVERNTSVNQIRTVKAMNVRLGIETNKESIAYVPVGTVFNYYEKRNGKSSVWYAVTPDLSQWVAGKSLSGDKKYVEELPASSPSPTPTPTPGQKFKIGDSVIISGKLYRSANASAAAGFVKSKKTVITRYAKGTKHPYNTKGDLGWMNESDIRKI